MVGLTSDYTELVKEYIPQGQKKSLWESFLTGTRQTYQGLTQQAQDIASYDISDAYANYKKQQLQLQMNEQLGAGFQQQAGQQLQSAYGSAYSDIKTQEATNLANIEAQKLSTIEKGEEQFTELGTQLRTYDKLISEYAELAGISRPINATTTTRDEYGVTTEELTDYGRLWYSDVLSAVSSEGTFDKWLLNEMSSSAVDYEDRVAFWEAYRQNPELFRQQVAGIGADFDAEATRTRLAEEDRLNAISELTIAAGERDVIDYATLTTKQAVSLRQDMTRNSSLVSSKKNNKFTRGKNLTDDYGQTWFVVDENPEVVKDYNNYAVGDIVKRGNSYYLVASITSKTAGLMKLELGG